MPRLDWLNPAPCLQLRCYASLNGGRSVRYIRGHRPNAHVAAVETRNTIVHNANSGKSASWPSAAQPTESLEWSLFRVHGIFDEHMGEELTSARDGELSIHPFEMCVHGTRKHREPIGDQALVVRAVKHALDNLPLSRRQLQRRNYARPDIAVDNHRQPTVLIKRVNNRGI